MKIERISEDQLKITLSYADLAERNLNITEFVNQTEKIEMFFREMLEKAMTEHSFSIENGSPIMIEAVPMAKDTIVLIVTKVDAQKYQDQYVNLIPGALDERRFFKKPIIFNINESEKSGSLAIFSFYDVDSVITASNKICGSIIEESSLYKFAQKYYLSVFFKKDADKRDSEKIEFILSEYGKKHNASNDSYLLEHGEIILKTSAVEKLKLI